MIVASPLNLITYLLLVGNYRIIIFDGWILSVLRITVLGESKKKFFFEGKIHVYVDLMRVQQIGYFFSD